MLAVMHLQPRYVRCCTVRFSSTFWEVPLGLADYDAVSLHNVSHPMCGHQFRHVCGLASVSVLAESDLSCYVTGPGSDGVP